MSICEHKLLRRSKSSLN